MPRSPRREVAFAGDQSLRLSVSFYLTPALSQGAREEELRQSSGRIVSVSSKAMRALVVIDNNNGQVIGSSRFNAHDEAKSEIEIGWTFLARSHWGGVYNREMKQLMLRHAFRFVESVIFIIGATNFRSQRAMEKIGGVRISSRLDADGRPNYVYQIRAATFRAADADA
jgi:RimJ/RimL family protein N-acetyltransferase